MDEITLKLVQNEAEMLDAMIDWTWKNGGVRTQEQGMLLLSLKGKLVREVEGKRKAGKGEAKTDAAG